ncbi:MAG: hypothetical protein RR100_20025 [Comamonas sp.]
MGKNLVAPPRTGATAAPREKLKVLAQNFRSFSFLARVLHEILFRFGALQRKNSQYEKETVSPTVGAAGCHHGSALLGTAACVKAAGSGHTQRTLPFFQAFSRLS